MRKIKEKTKNPEGRPTKFKKEYAQQLIKFFTVEPYKMVEEISSTTFYKDGGEKSVFKKHRPIANRMPTLHKFALSIGVDYKTVWMWAEKGKEIENMEGETEVLSDGFVEFCNAYRDAKELQKEFLVDAGIAGAIPSAAYIFTAKNITDMRDKIETTPIEAGVVNNNYNLILDPKYREALKVYEDSLKSIIINDIKSRVQINGPTTNTTNPSANINPKVD